MVGVSANNFMNTWLKDLDEGVATEHELIAHFERQGLRAYRNPGCKS
jgi:hypothetical protein